MKTRMNVLAVMALSILISLSASTLANGKDSRFASNHENATEPALTMESWMINDLLWHSSAAFNLIEAADEKLALETWMMSDFVWDEYAQDNEEIISLEQWMSNNFFWIQLDTPTETAASLEDWMVGNECWITSKPAVSPEREEPLKLEAWMTDSKNW